MFQFEWALFGPYISSDGPSAAAEARVAPQSPAPGGLRGKGRRPGAVVHRGRYRYRWV